MSHATLSLTAHLARVVVVAAFACLATPELAGAVPAFQLSFNGPDTSWQLLDSAARSRILSHECVPAGARDAAGAERIVAAAPAGESLLLCCACAHVAVLPELQVRLWIKSRMPAVQLAVRIALPRSRDPKTGEVVTVIARGAAYNRPDHWQQLVLSDVPKLLAAQLRVLRATSGAAIDAREAYVEAIVLVVPGNPHGVELLTDNLEVDGVLLAKKREIELTSYPAVQRSPAMENAAASGSARLQGGLLLIEGRPFVPRVIEWQGEPFSFLAERGFNAVQLVQPPNDEQISDAERNGLWFVSAAPRPEAIMGEGIGRSGDRVLAWVVNEDAAEDSANYAARWADLIRQHDRVAGRPVMMTPVVDWALAGKSAEILVARNPRQNRITAEEFDRWIERRPRFARPGTPLWSGFATQFGEAARLQVAELSTTSLMAPNLDLEHVRSLVRVACARNVRGFVFGSSSPLSEPDASTRRRATTLELINRRLQLIEPWLAGGKVIGRIPSDDTKWNGVVLHVDRARLVMPLPAAPRSNAGAAMPRTGSTSGDELVFLVPGVPESSQAFVFSPVALRALPLQRVAGGTRLTVPSGGDAFVLITEAPQVIQSLRRKIERDGRLIARLERDLVAQRAAATLDCIGRLSRLGLNRDAVARDVAAVNAQLQQIDAQLAAGRLEQAIELTNSSMRALEQIEAGLRRSVSSAADFDSNPLCSGTELLADCAAFQQSLELLRGGDNLLYGGNFEDLGQMTQVGWRNFRQPLPGVDSQVELSAMQPKHGGYCLALQVTTTRPESAAFESAPVWVVSPPMPVDEGRLIEITGWVRVDESLQGDGDGLQIADSLGGPETLLAIRRTSGWQPFRMIREVPEAGELRITFALAGIGKAYVDAVMVRTLSQPVARRLPSVAPPNGSADSNVAERAVPLLTAPQTQ